MGCTPFVYVANAGVNGIPTNGTIPLGAVVREHTECCGPGCKLDGTGIVCKGNNTAFEVVGTVTLEPADTTEATVDNDSTSYISVSVLQNGSTVQGSRVSAPDSGRVTLPIYCVIRNNCCSSDVVTLFNTGVAVNLVNVALGVKPV